MNFRDGRWGWGLLFTLTLSSGAWAVTYYIDYELGSDAQTGLSPTQAWQHCPGDDQAMGLPAGLRPQAGDVLQFKSDAVYRGEIHLDGRYVYGAPGAPITMKGDGWGPGHAVLDGSETLAGPWQACPSADFCAGNPNWASLYYAEVTPAASFQQGYFEHDDFLWYAQDPNPTDPFNYDRIGDFHVIPLNDPSISQTRTSITDPSTFTQSDPNFWNGAYVAVWRIPNVTVIRKVTGYDPGTHTLEHEDLGGDPYTDRDAYYSLLNHPALIDTPGEYALDETTHRMILWPRQTPLAAGSINRRVGGTGLFASCVKHLVIEGLTVQKYAMGIRAIDGGSGITPEDVVIRNNTVRWLKCNDGYAVQASGTNMRVENNQVTDCQRGVGILAGGREVTVRNNQVTRASRQGIWFMGAADSRILNNVVNECRGTHANGISVYSNSVNVEVAGNRVTLSNIPFTMEASANLSLVNNLFIGDGNTGYLVAGWGGMTGVITIYHNTIVNSSNHASIYIRDGGVANTVYLQNNILDGGGCGFRSHNLYTGLAWSQSSAYGWSLAPGEKVVTDVAAIFADPATGDYQLRQDSPALDAGTPTGVLSDFAGVVRPQGAGMDMGAYEYFTGNTGPAPGAAGAFGLVRIFPQPAAGPVTLQFNPERITPVEVEWFNLAGEPVTKIAGTVSPAQSGLVWNAGRLAPGLYFYRIRSNGHRIAKGKMAVK